MRLKFSYLLGTCKKFHPWDLSAGGFWATPTEFYKWIRKKSFEWIPLQRNSILRGVKIPLEVVFFVASVDPNCQLHSWPPIIPGYTIPYRIRRGFQWWHLKLPRLWFRGRTGRPKSKIPLEVVFFAVPFPTDSFVVFCVHNAWEWI